MANDGSYVSPSVTMDDSVTIRRNAVLDGEIRLGRNVVIDPGAVISGQFTIGDHTSIGPYSVLSGPGMIGSHNQIGPHCTIGAAAQHIMKPLSDGRIVIGNHNVIREYTTVHQPFETGQTRIGDHCYVMAYCHIAHDCTVQDNVIMANQATLGGHTLVYSYANLGLGVLIHQYCQLGAYSMVSMGSMILRDVLPFTMVVNQRVQKLNFIGLERRGISQADIEGINLLYHRFRPAAPGDESSWYGKIISEFCRNSIRGYYYPDADWKDYRSSSE
jgi:UDP-N-acetylglucosamine acyltransferase